MSLGLFCIVVFAVFKTVIDKDYERFRNAFCSFYSVKVYCEGTTQQATHGKQTAPEITTAPPGSTADLPKTGTTSPPPPPPSTAEAREFAIYEGQPSRACNTIVVAQTWKGGAAKVNFVFNGKSEDITFNQPLGISQSCVLTPLYAAPFAGQIQIYVRELTTK